MEYWDHFLWTYLGPLSMEYLGRRVADLWWKAQRNSTS